MRIITAYAHVFSLNLQHLNPNRYTGPESAARALAKNFSTNERSAARILDVAAGTGRLGAEVNLFYVKCSLCSENSFHYIDSNGNLNDSFVALGQTFNAEIMNFYSFIIIIINIFIIIVF